MESRNDKLPESFMSLLQCLHLDHVHREPSWLAAVKTTSIFFPVFHFTATSDISCSGFKTVNINDKL